MSGTLYIVRYTRTPKSLINEEAMLTKKSVSDPDMVNGALLIFSPNFKIVFLLL